MPCLQADRPTLLLLQFVRVLVREQEFPVELFLAGGSAAHLLQVPRCRFPWLLWSEAEVPCSLCGDRRGHPGMSQPVSSPSAAPAVTGAQTKTRCHCRLLQHGRKRPGVNKNREMWQQAVVAHTIQRDKGKLARDLPLPRTALLPSVTRENAEQSRENDPGNPPGTYSLTSGSKITFIQRTVNFGKALPEWGKED